LLLACPPAQSLSFPKLAWCQPLFLDLPPVLESVETLKELKEFADSPDLHGGAVGH